jgi:ribosomal subunit interface protein
MQVAPEIKFHDVERSDWVENYIVERVRRLERYAEGVTSCKVTLTQEQASQTKGNRYSVMVEVRTPPNHDLAVKKQKVVHEMHTQLPSLINLAFGAIEKQLKKTAQLRRADVKTHAGEPQEPVDARSESGANG